MSDNIAESFIYMDEEERKPREMVIYNIINFLWPTKKIAFFKSTGSSNIDTNWLSGTYFPTNGLSCHIENTENNINIFNKYNIHDGLESMRHVHGHIIKLSDYTKFLKNKEKVERSLGYTTIYYEFKDLGPFYKYLINKLTYYVTNKEFINANKDLIIINSEKYKKYTYYLNLLKTITDYFSCEEQIKISYSLSDHNEGLWSWEFCGITFVDICKEWWGELPEKIKKNPATDIDIYINTTKSYLNTDETYNYLMYKESIIDFDDFLKFIYDNNLFEKYTNISDFYIKYNQSFMIDSSPLVVKKALDFKKAEEKKIQQLTDLPPPPPMIPLQESESINPSATKMILPPPPIIEEISLIDESSINLPTENNKYNRRTRSSIKKRKSTRANLRSEKTIEESKNKRQRRISLIREEDHTSKSLNGGYVYRLTYRKKYKKHKTKQVKKTKRIKTTNRKTNRIKITNRKTNKLKKYK